MEDIVVETNFLHIHIFINFENKIIKHSSTVFLLPSTFSIMPEVETDERLTDNTARLSISISNLEGEDNPRHQFAEYLKASNESRRDSAVSLTSFNEETDIDTDLNGFKDKKDYSKQQTMNRQKRRRSSVQSISLGVAIDAPKPETKIHKKKLKKAKESPEFELITSANSDKKNPSAKKLSLTNIRDLIIHIFNKDSNQRLSWVKVKQAAEIKKVVFCFTPGLITEDFVDSSNIANDDKFISLSEQEKEDLSFFYEKFEYLIQATAPGSKDSLFLALHTLTNVPLTKKEKKDQIDKLKKNKLTLWDLLLSKESLMQNNYPIHSTLVEQSEDSITELNTQWTETKEFDHGGSHTFALDCEFCQSESGKVLTRISLINFQNEVVMDLLVKPEEEITDYLTKYSGITEAKLEGVTTTLKEVQEKLLNIISSSDILIGHSLESDLNVIKVKHPRIIDTALVYEHHRGPPLKPSLKWLSEKYLNRRIQEGEASDKGHSSIEDARACLDLIKLKLQEGDYFGKNMNEISLFERLNRAVSDSAKDTTSDDLIKSLLVDYTPIRENRNQEGNLRRVQVNNDDEAVTCLAKEIDNTDLIFLKLRELEFNKGWSPIPKCYDGYLERNSESQSNSEGEDSKDSSHLYKKLDGRLNAIYKSLPENTAFIVCSPQGDPNEMIRLQNIRKRFQALEREGVDLSSLSELESWNFDRQCELQQAVNLARKAMCFICLKHTPKND